MRYAGALLLAAGLAACGSDAREPRTHHVDIRAMQFVPAELTVAVGDTVIWTNADVMPHTVTASAPSAVTFDSHEIASKQQWTYTVTSTGELAYLCTYHPTMRAKLVAR